MTTWNYRVMAVPYTNGIVFEIREVYYTVDYKPKMYSEEAAILEIDESEGLEVLEATLERIRLALSKPILYAGDKFPQEYKLNNE